MSIKIIEDIEVPDDIEEKVARLLWEIELSAKNWEIKILLTCVHELEILLRERKLLPESDS